MAKKLGWGCTSVELATLKCDMAAVPGDGVSSSCKSEGQFSPTGKLSVCAGRDLGPRSLSTGTGLLGSCLQLSVESVEICPGGRVATPAGACGRAVQLITDLWALPHKKKYVNM